MAKRLLEVVTAVGSAPVFASLQLRVSVRRPLAKLRVATAAVERSEALGSSRAATFTSVSATQLDPAAALD